MGNLAYYLKYRPQTLSEVIGQESVKKNLLSSFQNNKLSHAYLFVGPRGTGKTSTARILAKMVNCESSIVIPAKAGIQKTENIDGSPIRPGMTEEMPCNKCSACISITDGSNLDLIEIDAASNRGIEDIRSLRDKIKLAPTASKKKVYIIDEVHMLTTEAFNALLKTLEEPPEHALFILATTDPGKIPQTILSRVQKLDFKLATLPELLEVLKRIVESEKIDIDEEALKILIKHSDGSFRDGVKLLDQVAAGEKITAGLVEETLKSSRFENILDLIGNMKDKNAAEGLLNISRQLENGIDVKHLMLSLMDIFRNLVLIKSGVGRELVEPQYTEDKYEELLKVSETTTSEELIRSLNILQEALEKLKFASIPSLPLELAVVEICTPSSVILTPSLAGEGSLALASRSHAKGGRSENASISETSPEILRGVYTERSECAQNDNKNVQDDKISIIADGNLKVVMGDRDEEINLPSSVIKESSSVITDPSSSSDILKLKEKWTFVLETIRPFNFSLEALLRSVNITECTENAVMMEVPYSFHQRILESPKNRDLLEGILSDILGRSIRVSTVLGNRPQRREDIANIEVAQDDEIIRAAAEIFNSDTVN